MQFYLKFDCRKRRNLTTSEPVLLRFSTDGGIYWTVLGRYDARASTESTYIVVNLPYAAKTNSTRVHWWQPISDGAHRVDWAIDQVNLFAVFQYAWQFIARHMFDTSLAHMFNHIYSSQQQFVSTCFRYSCGVL